MAEPGDGILSDGRHSGRMGIVIAFVGALIAWSLFGSKNAKSRAEHSGLESGMILLGLVAFGALFAILF